MAHSGLLGGVARPCAVQSAALAGWEPRAAPASPPLPALNMTVLALSNTRCPRHRRLPIKHAYFPMEHGHLPIKHGHFPIKLGRLHQVRLGRRLPPRAAHARRAGVLVVVYYTLWGALERAASSPWALFITRSRKLWRAASSTSPLIYFRVYFPRLLRLVYLLRLWSTSASTSPRSSAQKRRHS